MNAWLWSHVDAFVTTLARLVRTPVATLLNVGVLGIALALPTGLYVALANVQGHAQALAADPRLSVFLALDAGRTEIVRTGTRLREHPGVGSVRYVSRDEALGQLKTRTGLADVVDSLAENPLPDAFVVQPRDAAPQALEQLRDELRGWPKVAHVQLDAMWARRLEAALRLARLAVWLLATLFAFALVAVTFNTIRLQILTRREEIEVAKLIGATDPFIRRPLLYFGAVQGLAGGLAAWAIVAISLYWLNGGLANLSQLYGTPLELQQLTPEDGLSLLLFSAVLGWFGAWLSVNQHLARLDLR
ncbi:MAG: permease-like cell division protein FtsX [Betaproteobacteria bacterium]|nr:permease-like cell division protein FtsX [Betaproteobacteria bacterium]MDH3436081.1 permease-like cell division protein FtsX [Betaproteobacteria bacterium]